MRGYSDELEKVEEPQNQLWMTANGKCGHKIIILTNRRLVR